MGVPWRERCMLVPVTGTFFRNGSPLKRDRITGEMLFAFCHSSMLLYYFICGTTHILLRSKITVLTYSSSQLAQDKIVTQKCLFHLPVACPISYFFFPRPLLSFCAHALVRILLSSSVIRAKKNAF